MLPVQIDPRDAMPLYAQLERSIRGAIASGALKAGDKLPTVRQLAVDLRINANTVAKVYLELERAGVLETRRGVGTFVAPPRTGTPLIDRLREIRSLTDSYALHARQLGFSNEEIIDFLTNKLKEVK